MSRLDVLADVNAERDRQETKWGEQNHPDGTGGPLLVAAAIEARRRCESASSEGRLTYGHILAEEAAEAFAESDKAALRKELVQVAAVAVAWVEKLDREAASGVTMALRKAEKP